MEDIKKIKRALISVYHKQGLDNILKQLSKDNVEFISTGGTQAYLESCGYNVTPVENLTGYPSILGGRVKTLHPSIFGGILCRCDRPDDLKQAADYNIQPIDLVIVDLYPFSETVASGATEQEIIEKIDIGGISLIRAAAKNFKDVVIVASQQQYELFDNIMLRHGAAATTLLERRQLAGLAFSVSSGYDTAIYNYFDVPPTNMRVSIDGCMPLRYGENPHQKGWYYGNFSQMFTQLHGKEISYNNLLDIDSALSLISDFQEPTIAIIKHNNACGIASGTDLTQIWRAALECDPISAFGGVIICNQIIDKAVAEEMTKLFFEVVIAPDYTPDALEILKEKKKRVILQAHSMQLPAYRMRSALNGCLIEEADTSIQITEDFRVCTKATPDARMAEDMVLANKLVKHYKSNAIVLVNHGRLIGAGMGQTSRIEALRQAIVQARALGHDLQGAVMASDAFFPFSDCVCEAYEAGVRAVIQPGGSIRDNDSIEYCDAHAIPMVMTGVRHFKH